MASEATNAMVYKRMMVYHDLVNSDEDRVARRIVLE